MPTGVGDVLEASKGRFSSLGDARDAARFRVSRNDGESGLGKDEVDDNNLLGAAELEALAGCF